MRFFNFPLFENMKFICLGIPTIIRSFLPPHVKIVLQGENGILGIGPYPQVNGEDPDLINAGNEAVTAMPGHSYFQSTTSFGMYRGRHMNTTIIGGMQVSKKGDIANWVVPNRLIKVFFLLLFNSLNHLFHYLLKYLKCCVFEKIHLLYYL